MGNVMLRAESEDFGRGHLSVRTLSSYLFVSCCAVLRFDFLDLFQRVLSHDGIDIVFLDLVFVVCSNSC